MGSRFAERLEGGRRYWFMTTPRSTKSPAPGLPLERCKVCTKRIRPGEDQLKVYHAGAYHVLCCASCAAKFELAPNQYLTA